MLLLTERWESDRRCFRSYCTGQLAWCIYWGTRETLAFVWYFVTAACEAAHKGIAGLAIPGERNYKGLVIKNHFLPRHLSLELQDPERLASYR